jgi:hypothetical protein
MIRLFYFIGALALVGLDKLTTILVIKKAMKKYGDRALSMEKNPLQSYFFKEFGLNWGAVIYGLFSLFTFFFSTWLLSFPIGLTSSNSWGIAYGVIASLYGIVIINNLFQGRKYGNN